MQGPTFTLEGVFLFSQVIFLNQNSISYSNYIYILKYASIKCLLEFIKEPRTFYAVPFGLTVQQLKWSCFYVVAVVVHDIVV